MKKNENQMYFVTDIFIELLQKEFRIRYKSKFFGYLWSLMNPLANALVYYIVFGILMKNRQENYPIFLIAGLFPWQWIANSISTSPMSFISNAKLVKKIAFPRNMIQFVTVFQDMVHFIISIPIILIFMYAYEIPPSLSWLWGFPILLALQFVTLYSISLLLGIFNLFFRDTERLVQIFLMYFFYFTPILYSVSKVPERFHDLLYLHPFAPIVISWRELFLTGNIPWNYVGSATLYSIILFALARYFYKKLSWRLAEIL